VSITGTDLDGRALDVARQGRYPRIRLRQVTEAECLSWFVPDGEALIVGRGLRRLCRFRQANLLRDPAPGPADLVVCRNLLIYLDPTQQQRVLALFHRALSPGGYLALGAVERVAGPALDWFQPVDTRERIYRHDVAA
jgi:two-component system CheB/CheR fusion protein